MPLNVNTELCKRERFLCRGVSSWVVHRQTTDAFPSYGKGEEELCIKCGHCVAVCPEGALSVEDVPPQRCMPVQRKRFSIRSTSNIFSGFRRSGNYSRERVPQRFVQDYQSGIACSFGPQHPARPWLEISSEEEIRFLQDSLLTGCEPSS